MRTRLAATLFAALLSLGGAVSAAAPAPLSPESLKSLEDELVLRHGEAAREHAKRIMDILLKN